MADGIEQLPRGIRNKNPGNIKLGTDWEGWLMNNQIQLFVFLRKQFGVFEL